MKDVFKKNNARAKNVGIFLGTIAHFIGKKILKTIFVLCLAVVVYILIVLINLLITTFIGKDGELLKKFSAFLVRNGFKNLKLGDVISLKINPNLNVIVVTHSDGCVEDKFGKIYIHYNEETMQGKNSCFESISRNDIVKHERKKK
jgi:hypothetical protein